MKKLWRVENPNTMQGLWYAGDGSYSPMVTRLSDGQCADLPMGYSEEFKAEGRDWFSACDNIPELKTWFSLKDLEELSTLGYGLYEFTVPDYKIVTGHAIFLRETAVAVPVPLSLITPGNF